MEENKKQQIVHWFSEFIEIANNFWKEDNIELFNYWKGQVMGLSKMVNLLELDIDTDYYLKKMP